MEQHGYEKYKAVLASVGGYLPAARILMQRDREALKTNATANITTNTDPGGVVRAERDENDG